MLTAAASPTLERYATHGHRLSDTSPLDDALVAGLGLVQEMSLGSLYVWIDQNWIDQRPAGVDRPELERRGARVALLEWPVAASEACETLCVAGRGARFVARRIWLPI